jgi:5-enolpyruvylshikimate-3-phosphate synthase
MAAKSQAASQPLQSEAKAGMAGIKGEFELYTEQEAFCNCAFLAALADGCTIIQGVKATPPVAAFADYLKKIGAQVSIKNEQWEITGTNFKHEKPLDLEWIGDDFPHQKRNKKVIESLLNGVPFHSEEKIAVKDSLIRELATFGAEVKWWLDGPDENDELAKRMAKLQGIKTERKWICDIPPVPSLFARDRFIAGSVAQAAFLALAASLIPDSDILIKSVSLDSSRAGIFGAFKRLGADIEIASRHERSNDVWGDLRVKTSKALMGKRLNADILSTCLDEIPMLAVLACFAEEETILKFPPWSIEICKPVLETLYKNLKTAGISSGLYEDGIILRGKEEISGESFDCEGNAIIGLALCVLNKKAKGKQNVNGIECVENLYPEILKLMEN